MFLNLRHNAEHVDLAISATGRPQENKTFRFLQIHKKTLLTQIVKFFRRNIGLDRKIKSFDVMGTLGCKNALTAMYIKLATGTKLAKRCNINAQSTNASYLH